MKAWMWCAAVVMVSSAACAEDLNLSGIIKGNRPTAIVNDQVVGQGDSVGSYRVVEISDTGVVFENAQGRVTKQLKELEEKKTAATAASATASKALFQNPFKSSSSPSSTTPAPAATPAAQQPVPVSAKAGKFLDRSMQNLRAADDLLKTSIPHDALFAKAAALCEEAARDAQQGLNAISDESSRGPIKDHLAKIRKLLADINKQKDELNFRVRTAIAKQEIFPGMTAQNVISSWGAPLGKTNVGPIERWTYKDPHGYQKELNFSNGILASFK